MTARWSENSFGFGRRLRVDWSALSWRPPIIAMPPLAGVRMADERHRVGFCRFQVPKFRQSSETPSRQSAQCVPSLRATFRNLPPPRVNNSSRTEL